jgi:hypothetical protein
MRFTKTAAVAAGAFALVAVGGVGGAVAGGLIQSNQIATGAIHTHNIKAGAVTLAKISAGAQAHLKGSSATVSVTAVTHLTNRSDSATDGSTWAKDNFNRTAIVTRQHASPASKCGPAAVTCWFYTETNSDMGTFTTVAGANSPQHQVSINGVVSGSMVGANHLEFYADSATPKASRVPATLSGDTGASSGTWPAKFFANGTTVTDPTQIGWSWTYTAPSTCEAWTNSVNGNTGDVTGTNACQK